LYPAKPSAAVPCRLLLYQSTLFSNFTLYPDPIGTGFKEKIRTALIMSKESSSSGISGVSSGIFAKGYGNSTWLYQAKQSLTISNRICQQFGKTKICL